MVNGISKPPEKLLLFRYFADAFFVPIHLLLITKGNPFAIIIRSSEQGCQFTSSFAFRNYTLTILSGVFEIYPQNGDGQVTTKGWSIRKEGTRLKCKKGICGSLEFEFYRICMIHYLVVKLKRGFNCWLQKPQLTKGNRLDKNIAQNIGVRPYTLIKCYFSNGSRLVVRSSWYAPLVGD